MRHPFFYTQNALYCTVKSVYHTFQSNFAGRINKTTLICSVVLYGKASRMRTMLFRFLLINTFKKPQTRVFLFRSAQFDKKICASKAPCSRFGMLFHIESALNNAIELLCNILLLISIGLKRRNIRIKTLKPQISIKFCRFLAFHPIFDH